MKNTLNRLCWMSLLSFGLATCALADEDTNMRMEPLQVNRLDDASLQRGATTFMNYCMNCHGAQFMRYNRLQDIGLKPDQISKNLMFATAKMGDTMVASMTRADAKTWFGAAPPDLSVEARVRGREWLYGYLRAFYRDDSSRTGWNNLLFPNVGMPHVLWELEGTQKLNETVYDSEDAAEAEAVKIGDLVQVETRKIAGPDGKEKEVYAVESLVIETPGKLKPVEYKAMVGDLVNYLDYMAEPAKTERIRLGLMVLIFLGVLFAFAYMLKREYWKDVH